MIDDAGLVVTIGYLITEAMAAEVTTAAGKTSRAEIIGFDTESGLGLLRAVEPLEVKPMPIGTAKGLTEKDAGNCRGPWRSRGGASRCRRLPPDLRRLLGVPAGRRDLHRAALLPHGVAPR